jgi:predicted aspartyl protease
MRTMARSGAQTGQFDKRAIACVRSSGGRRMHRPTIVALVVAYLAMAPGVARADEAPHCGLLQATTLTMHFDSEGRPEVPVAIEGKEETMMVDTGGVYTMVTDATIKDLDLRIEPIDPGLYYSVQTGQTISRKVVAHSMSVGRIKLARPDFLVVSADRLDSTTAGVLAPDILRRFDIEFDFANGKFNAFSQDHCPGKVVYWATDYAVVPFKMNELAVDEPTEAGFHIIANAVLDGKEVRITIDTGSDASYMTTSDAQRLFGLNIAGLTRLDRGTDTADATYTYTFKALDLHGISVQNPKIVLMPDKLGDPNEPELIVGMSILRKLHLYVA